MKVFRSLNKTVFHFISSNTPIGVAGAVQLSFTHLDSLTIVIPDGAS